MIRSYFGLKKTPFDKTELTLTEQQNSVFDTINAQSVDEDVDEDDACALPDEDEDMSSVKFATAEMEAKSGSAHCEEHEGAEDANEMAVEGAAAGEAEQTKKKYRRKKKKHGKGHVERRRLGRQEDGGDNHGEGSGGTERT